MNKEIMSDVLKRLDRTMKMQNRNVVLFLDNATSYQESIEKNLPNIKLVFLPEKHNVKVTTFGCRNNKSLQVKIP